MNHQTDIKRRQFIKHSLLLAGAGSALLPDGGLALGQAEVKQWSATYDVVIAGGGVAGLCAAYEAAMAGAQVLLVDNGGAAANGSHGTKIYLGGGTALQQAFGISDTPERMFNYLAATAGPNFDIRRIEVLASSSIDTFRWLMALEIPFDWKTPGKSLQYSGSERDYPWRDRIPPARRGHIPDVPGAATGVRGGGAWLQATLLKKLRALGGHCITAQAEQLITAADGAVVGIRYASGGKRLDARGRSGVILATGGFANNDRMVADHCSWYSICKPADIAWNDGWGIRAGQAAGGATRGLGACSVTWSPYPPDSRRQGILLNAAGCRFIAEDSYSGRIGDAIVRQQNGHAVLLVDQAIMQDGAGRFGDVVLARTADIPQLAEALSIPGQALETTLQQYNHYAQRRVDPLFNKNPAHIRPLSAPPYTAISAAAEHITLPFFTLGGLGTSIDGAVLSPHGEPIPGLYAVGRVSAGAACPSYFSSGLSLADCITFGRRAGQAVARLGSIA